MAEKDLMSPAAVAYQMALRIEGFEAKGVQGEEYRKYFLKLYANCYAVTIGRDSPYQ